MGGKFFKSFSEASGYAKDQAILNESIFDIKRNGDSWEVISLSAKKQEQKTEIIEQELTATKEELGKLRSDINKLTLEEQAEVKRNEKELEETEKERKEYLQERSQFFRTLSEEELDLLWNKNIITDSDEKHALRAAIRNKKGIGMGYIDAVTLGQKVCRQCGMVGDNCTCSRSWF